MQRPSPHSTESVSSDPEAVEPGGKPLASVVVPARDAEPTLPATLAALDRQDLGGPFEVVVVDDGSTDRTGEIASGWGGRVRTVRGPGEGPGPARNLGAREAAGQLLAFTDADCRPRTDWLRLGVEALSGADLVQGTVVPDPQATRRPFDRTISVTREHGLYETANMFVRRDLFGRLGGFRHPVDAGGKKPLGEDVWFGWRARRDGSAVRFSGEAVVEHEVFDRPASEFVAERFRLRHFPPLVAVVPELRHAFLWKRLFLNRRTAAFDAGLTGILAAAVLAPRSPAAALLVMGAWLPYTAIAVRDARPWGRRAPLVLAASAAADAVGCASLLAGSARARTPVL